MRLWLVAPRILCDQHLLGEHVECHMFIGTLAVGKRLHGYWEKGLLPADLQEIPKRHDMLAREMEARGMNHATPMGVHEAEVLAEASPAICEDRVDVEGNVAELQRRCQDCEKRISQAKTLDIDVTNPYNITVME